MIKIAIGGIIPPGTLKVFLLFLFFFLAKNTEIIAIEIVTTLKITPKETISLILFGKNVKHNDNTDVIIVAKAGTLFLVVLEKHFGRILSFAEASPPAPVCLIRSLHLTQEPVYNL